MDELTAPSTSKQSSEEPQFVEMTASERLVSICKIEKDAAYNFREPRQPEWTENYQFYHNKVTLNRLTQRQAVNIPLMKYTVKTLLKDIDDPPMLYFFNRSNDAQKEVFYNEYWKYCAREDKLVVKDMVDKKQVLMFGRSFKKLNIVNGRFSFEIVDPQDMLVDRYLDPTNLDSANFVCHEHIMRPLSLLEQNPFYDKEQVLALKEFYATAQGLIKAEENKKSLEDKTKRWEMLGIIDAATPSLGETVVELNENYIKIWDETAKRAIIWLVVMAEGKFILNAKPLHEIIGKTKGDYWMDHFPFTTWGEDPERTYFWCEGVCDGIRTINKVLNAYISQKVENRTLRNFGMQYYDTTAQQGGFVPQTFDPVPFGWYPVPGKPTDVVQRVEIPELSDTINDIKLLLDIADKTSGASSTSQGDVQSQKVTLGEIQLALTNAKERVKGMAPLYTESWEDFGVKYTKMLEGAGGNGFIDAVTVYKKGKETKHIYTKEIGFSDWRDEEGYDCEVKDLSQNSSKSNDLLQKINAAVGVMPNNKPLKDIYKQKMLEWSEFTATQIKEVMDAERELDKPQTTPVVPNGGTGDMGGLSTVTPTPPMLTA